MWGDARQSQDILSITARKALAELRKGSFDYDNLILPARVDELPPSNVNIYADGGLTAPTKQHYGLPAAGIFARNRFTSPDNAGNQEPLEAAEAQFPHAYRQLQDWCICMPIPGIINSSTRSEAHGLLAALCSAGPVHIGIDNKAVVDRAAQLITAATDLFATRESKAMLEQDGLALEISRK